MAIVRLGQITAETGSTNEWVQDSGNGPALSSTKVRTGTYSWRLDFATNNRPFGLGFSSTTQIRANYFINHNGAQNTTYDLILYKWVTPTSALNYLMWDSGTGEVHLKIAGSTVATISGGVAGIAATDTWLSMGLTLFTNASTGWVSFYVDGVQKLTYSGNTHAGVTTLYGPGEFVTLGWNNYAYVDDFYIDSTVGESDAPPPSKRFLFTQPNGNGTNSAWNGSDGDQVNNYEMVDEAPPDDDTTFLTIDSATQKDDYTVAGITVPVGYQIDAAIPISQAFRSDVSVPSTLKLYSYDGATYQVGSEKTLPASYGYVFEYQELQPDGTAWNEADFNNTEFGMESSGSY